MSDYVLFNIASYTAIMRQKTIPETPAKKMAFLATCLSCLVIYNLYFFFIWWKILWNAHFYFIP